MRPRTVLVYLDDESAVERLVPLAARIVSGAADGAAGLLVGVHLAPLMPLYGGVADALSGGIAVRYAEAQQAIGERVRRRFTDAAHAAGVACDWDALDGEALGESVALRERARACDLVVLPQPPLDGDGRYLEIAIRELVTGAGRPVLVLPRVGRFETLGRRLLIGWSPTREATRAVHDALALAEPGARATLLWVSHGRGVHPELERSARAMAAHLARHGIEAEVAHWANAEIAIGDALLNESLERGADLLVTGGYGHSRFYDAVLGATTSHLLAHMTLPVLFAH